MPTENSITRNAIVQYPVPTRSVHERDLETRNARLARYVARLLEERLEPCPNCRHVRIERAQ